MSCPRACTSARRPSPDGASSDGAALSAGLSAAGLSADGLSSAAGLVDGGGVSPQAVTTSASTTRPMMERTDRGMDGISLVHPVRWGGGPAGRPPSYVLRATGLR